MGQVRLGKRTENRYKLVKDLVPLAPLDDLVFGGWISILIMLTKLQNMRKF